MSNEDKDINENNPGKRKPNYIQKKHKPVNKHDQQERKDLQANNINRKIQQEKHISNPKISRENSILSVVIPLFNEEESLPELALLLESELEKLTKGRYEVIFIDDGSTDKSFQVIRTIHERNRKFRAIRFRRNYGKSAALSVGFDEAKGVIVCTMDADLQDDPSEIRNLVDKLREGYDLVSGWKKKRQEDRKSVV